MRKSLESLVDIPHYQQHIGAEHTPMFAHDGFESLLEHMHTTWLIRRIEPEARLALQGQGNAVAQREHA
jgi:hypothetical protein